MKNASRLVLFLALALAAGPALSDGHAYVGTKKCRMCHIKEWTSWSGTKMANAFELLKPGVAAEAKTKAKLDPMKDYTSDATCLPCHTTGYGKPGGFRDLATTPDLVGVGCEMCHGAGADFAKPDQMSLTHKDYKRADLVKVGLVGEITQDQCAVCHNHTNPFFKEFNFEERKAKGTHEKTPLKFQH